MCVLTSWLSSTCAKCQLPSQHKNSEYKYRKAIQNKKKPEAAATNKMVYWDRSLVSWQHWSVELTVHEIATKYVLNMSTSPVHLVSRRNFCGSRRVFTGKRKRADVRKITRWFKYDRDWFVCKQAALRSSCATLREWSHNLHPPSCSG